MSKPVRSTAVTFASFGVSCGGWGLEQAGVRVALAAIASAAANERATRRPIELMADGVAPPSGDGAAILAAEETRARGGDPARRSRAHLLDALELLVAAHVHAHVSQLAVGREAEEHRG